jgi:hypothetical protein
MKAIAARIRRLEKRKVRVEDSKSQLVADPIRERRRRRCEASGEPFEALPLQPISALPGRRRSIAETLRQHRLEAHERNRATLSGAPG